MKVVREADGAWVAPRLVLLRYTESHGGWILWNLGRPEGVWVNDRRVEKLAYVHVGDKVRIGTVRCVLGS